MKRSTLPHPHPRTQATLLKSILTSLGILMFASTAIAGEPFDRKAYFETKAKLKKAQMNELNFERAPISEVLEFLVAQSRELDAQGDGFNLIYLPPKQKQGAPAHPQKKANVDPFLEDLFGLELEDAQPVPVFDPETRITIRLRRVSMYDALKYITEMANLTFTIDKNVVIVRPKGQGGENIQTRFYSVDPSLMQKHAQARAQMNRLNNKDPFDF